MLGSEESERGLLEGIDLARAIGRPYLEVGCPRRSLSRRSPGIGLLLHLATGMLNTVNTAMSAQAPGPGPFLAVQRARQLRLLSAGLAS